MIRVEHVSKQYGRRVVLRDVSFEVHPGEVTLLSGANGAGKSTLLRCLLGITDCEGSISVAGLDPLRHGCAVRSLAGYMPQISGLHPDLTVADTMRLYAEIRAISFDRAATLLDEAGLSAHHRTTIGDLSRGMRQRLAFAMALLIDPVVLVLDEPRANLDGESRIWLARRLRAIAREGRTLLVTSAPEQEPADAVDRRLVLEDGRCTDAESAATQRPPPPAAEGRADEPILLGPDQTLFTPAAHDADRSLDGRSGHVGQLLAGQRQRHESAAALGPALLCGEFEKQAGEARLDSRATQFRQPIGQFHEAVRQAKHQPADERRMRLEEQEEHGTRDDDAGGVIQSRGARWKWPAVVGGQRANGIASSEYFQNDVFARRQHPEDLHSSRRNGVERIGRHALLENDLPFLVAADDRNLGDLAPVLSGELLEHRRRAQDVVDVVDAAVHRIILGHFAEDGGT